MGESVSPLSFFDVHIAKSSQPVGVLGCSLPLPVDVNDLLSVVQDISDEWQITFQLLDAAYVAGPQHLVFATSHALNAFHYGAQRASALGMEILRFAAAQRQIHRAIAILGIRDSTQQVGGVLLGGTRETLTKSYKVFLNRTGSTDNPKVLEVISDQKEAVLLEAFNISMVELHSTMTSKRVKERRQALQKLVFDRCALLAITH